MISQYWDNTGCTRKNLPYFWKMFLSLNYMDLTGRAYVQSNGDNEEIRFKDWGLVYVYQFHIEYGLK